MSWMKMTLIAAIFVPATAVACPDDTPNKTKDPSQNQTQAQDRDDNDAANETPNEAAPTPERDTQRARLGVVVMPMGRELRAYFGAPADRGMLVARIVPRSLAARAGVRVGDIITEVNGDRVQDANDIIDALAKPSAGVGARPFATLEIVRDHKTLDLRTRPDRATRQMTPTTPPSSDPWTDTSSDTPTDT